MIDKVLCITWWFDNVISHFRVILQQTREGEKGSNRREEDYRNQGTGVHLISESLSALRGVKFFLIRHHFDSDHTRPAQQRQDGHDGDDSVRSNCYPFRDGTKECRQRRVHDPAEAAQNAVRRPLHFGNVKSSCATASYAPEDLCQVQSKCLTRAFRRKDKRNPP